jgi:hypothetical protein
MWDEIFDVLVKSAGALESDRGSFLACQPTPEFRFVGYLGFGGKFRVDNNKLYIDCYPEDKNDERVKIIDDVNAQLAEIK